MTGSRRSPRKISTEEEKAEDPATESNTEAESEEAPAAPSKNANAEATTKEGEKTAEVHLPPYPVDRDVVVGDETHKGTMILMDLIRLYYFILKKENGGDATIPNKEGGIEDLASRLTDLMLEGKKFVLSGIKDVPAPFLKGPGRFFEKEGEKSTQLSKEQAKEFVAKTILELFKEISTSSMPSEAELDECVEALFKNCDPANKSFDDPSHFSAPRPCDVLFLPIEFPWDESMPYEHQSGNKHILFLASQYVASDTNDTNKRVEAAFRLVTSKVDINVGTELIQKTPRYVAQESRENQNSWRELTKEELAEVFLEKQIHGMGVSLSSQVANLISETAKPSTDPIDQPKELDVLFGRGGGTNGWPGNRRFRDIIALHRPDYIRATKMDKPNVARRIVRAIRLGNPPGHFLRKSDDGKWYDVGDRCAAEKTSQGLRERSNTEKRQRSALREVLRIRREDLEDGKEGDPAAKKAKTDVTLMVPSFVGVTQLNYTGGIPLSLSMKEQPKDSVKGKKSKTDKNDDEPSESLPPNAVDKDGNILVTEYDILSGRGGLTNHHKGNKRFRDIVALHRPDYVRAPKIQKPSVARVIVRAIRNGDPPGRFLRKDEKTGKWIDIGDKKAAEKTSQALREKTDEEKEGSLGAPFQSPPLLAPDSAPAAVVVGSAAEDEAEEKKKDDDEEDGQEPKVNSDEKRENEGIGDKKGKSVESIEV